MNMVDIILKKKAGGELNEEEIRFFARGAADGSIPDYQLSALLAGHERERDDLPDDGNDALRRRGGFVRHRRRVRG